MRIYGPLKLGTAVRVVVSISVATATSMKISIEDPYDTTIVDEADMTKEADGYYSYIWQSSEYPTGKEGVYDVITKATYGGYDSVKESNFRMERAG